MLDQAATKTVHTFLRNERGNISVQFGLLAMPMLMLVGTSIDYGRAIKAQSVLQGAADSAALAAAFTPGGINTSEKSAAAKKTAEAIFAANSAKLSYAAHTQPDVNIVDSVVKVSASMELPTTISAIISEKLEIAVQSQASPPKAKAPLCLLGLNSSSADAVRFWGTADLVSPDCAVQSNSTSANGMVTGGSASATASLFCTVGGHSGTGFTPTPYDKCPKASDPYAGKYSSAALAAAGINLMPGCTYNALQRVRRNTEFNAGGPNRAVEFCGGLEVATGAVATFRPGIYIVDNVFSVASQGKIDAPQGVTFVLGSSNINGVKIGTMTVQGGGNLTLKAPTSGPLAGIAILQNTVAGYTGGSTPAVTHTIIGGGVINIVGTIYTPQSKVRITGNGTINSDSAYFGLVADFVEVEGNGELVINAASDHLTAGMPAMDIAGPSGGGGYLTN
jgi:hypothetical protein